MSGDDGEVVTPVPIPNTEVKHFSAEDSIMDAKIGRCQANLTYFKHESSSVYDCLHSSVG